MIADICEVKKLYIPTPTMLVRFMAFMFDKYEWFPITRVQLEMLVDGNVCNSKRVFHDYNITEMAFGYWVDTSIGGEADDEVGFFFDEMKQLGQELEQLFETEVEDGNKEEEKKEE